MTWREVDYHGSRSYGADEPKAGPVAAIIAWLASRARRKASKAGDRRRAGTLPPGAQRGFSLLGASSPAPARKAANSPFPVKADDFGGRDCRLLP